MGRWCDAERCRSSGLLIHALKSGQDLTINSCRTATAFSGKRVPNELVRSQPPIGLAPAPLAKLAGEGGLRCEPEGMAEKAVVAAPKKADQVTSFC